MSALPSGFSADILAASSAFHDSTRATLAVPAAALPRRSVPALLSAVQHLVERLLAKRVPRLDALRERLQHAAAGTGLAPLERAMGDLQGAASALDVLAARAGGAVADAVARQCVAVTAAGNDLWTVAGELSMCDAAHTPVLRLLWIELLLEARALEKRVHAGMDWLAEVEEDLAARRADASMEVTHRALDELSRRSGLLRERLQGMRSLCSLARAVHAAGEQLADGRAALCRTLQHKVRAGSTALQERMQPLVRATSSAELRPADLVALVDARHELQVALTQAAAEAGRLGAHEQELASELARFAGQASQLA